mgnify:CR=1 FL=1
MAELKLWQRVNNLTGQSSKSRYLVPFINNASKWLINSLPEKFLWSIASTTESDATQNGLVGREGDVDVVGTGSGIAYDKILAVWRYETTYSSGTANEGTIGKRVKRPCLEIPDSLLYATDESDSIHFPTRMFPKFYKLAGKIYVKPDPDYNEEALAANGGDDLVYTDPAGTTVTVSGQNGDKAVIVYAAPPLATENTDSWILAEWDNVVIMYAASQDMMRIANSQLDNIINSTTGLLKVTSDLLTSYQSAVPAYTPPSPPTITTLSAGDFPTPPSEPNVPIYSYTNPSTATLPAELESIVSTLPSFVAPSGPSFDLSFTDFDTEMTKAKDLMDKGFDTNEEQGSGLDRSVDSSAVLSIGYDLWNEDVEVVQAKLGAMSANVQVATQELQKQQSRLSDHQANLQQYQNDVQKEGQRVQSELANYSAELGKVVQNAQTKVATYSAEQRDKQSDLQAQTEQYGGTIAKYNADLQSYSAQVTKVINEYQTETSFQLQQYSSDVQAESAKFQANMEAAKNYLEQAGTRMQQAQLRMGVSGDCFQKSSTFYQWAVNELRSGTGGLSAPAQQQAAQRGEEQSST